MVQRYALKMAFGNGQCGPAQGCGQEDAEEAEVRNARSKQQAQSEAKQRARAGQRPGSGRQLPPVDARGDWAMAPDAVHQGRERTPVPEPHSSPITVTAAGQSGR